MLNAGKHGKSEHSIKHTGKRGHVWLTMTDRSDRQIGCIDDNFATDDNEDKMQQHGMINNDERE